MRKRAKSVDAAHSSTPLTRVSRVGGASIIPRYSTVNERLRMQRPQNITRYSRHGPRHLKPQQTEFRIRASVADLVMKELDDFDRCIFYQRVFILAKNVTLTVTAQSSVASILSKFMHSKTSLNVDAQTESQYVEEQVEEEGEFSEVEFDEFSQTPENVNTQLKSPEGQLLQLTRADFESSAKEKRMQELDFFDQFKDKVEIIVRKCEFEQLSEDRFTGLLLCMGNSHTLFVLEGTEDTIALFCQELQNISSTYFEAMRVFLVEDRIEEAYFEEFVFRRSVAMNINEKFPPPTANDPQLMGSQHWLIKEKLRILCETLSYELRPKVEAPIVEILLQPSVQIIEEEKKPPKRVHKRKQKKRTKSPITAVAADAQAEADVASKRTGSANSEAAGSLSRTSAHREIGETEDIFTTEPVEQIEEEISFSTAVAPAEAAKSEEAADPKEPSNVRLQPIATVIGAEPDVPEEIEEEEFIPIEVLKPFAVNPSIYNRLLPEVQRIDLVLTSKRFYLDLAQFVPFSQEIPMQPDEDALIWPTSFNYLPLNVFERLPYDVNLTFGNYDVKDTEEEETDSSEDDDGKADKDDKKEG